MAAESKNPAPIFLQCIAVCSRGGCHHRLVGQLLCIAQCHTLSRPAPRPAQASATVSTCLPVVRNQAMFVICNIPMQLCAVASTAPACTDTLFCVLPWQHMYNVVSMCVHPAFWRSIGSTLQTAHTQYFSCSTQIAKPKSRQGIAPVDRERPPPQYIPERCASCNSRPT